jgi:hypothetical protein
MSTKNKWLIGIGIVVGLIVLFALPFAWHALFPVQGYGMTLAPGTSAGVGGYGMHGYGFSPMRGGFGFGMSFMLIIPLALLALIGLGIAALIKYLRAP